MWWRLTHLTAAGSGCAGCSGSGSFRFRFRFVGGADRSNHQGRGTKGDWSGVRRASGIGVGIGVGVVLGVDVGLGSAGGGRQKG
jgi:hypothetical protein